MSENAETDGAQRVLTEAPSGKLVDLGDLSEEQRVVSPDVIRRLCIGPDSKDVDPRGIRITGARIVESLNLSFCTAPHPLRLEATTFDTMPDLSGAHLPALWLENCSFPGLLASGIRIDDLRLGSSKVSGGVWLSNARIGGQLNCSGATLSNEDGAALMADGAEIKGHVVLGGGFSATGGVSLLGAKIGGQLDCSGATLTNGAGIALVARDATVGSTLIFRNVDVTGGIDLFRASATTLDDDLGQADDPLGSWRGVQPLVLDSFAYARFGHEAEWGSKSRRRWLKQSSGFQYGAWQQLIEVYRGQGRGDEATRAAIAMHNDRLSRAGLPWYRVAARWVLWAVVGHGYRPWLAGIWAAAIIAAFALIVWQWSGMFVPEKPGLTGSPQPVAYAADTFLPIVDLGQAGDWMPTVWLRWVEWSVILLGWSLSTIFVAGFTRIVRSE